MLKVLCKTNLDLFYEEWPTELPALPNVGDIIVSMTKHKTFQLELEVVSITWRYSNYHSMYIPEIELHMTKWQKLIVSKSNAAQGSITAFYEWYSQNIGKHVGYFI